MKGNRPDASPVVTGLLGLALALRPAPAAGQRPPYLELVERYARGERAAAVSALGEWRELKRQEGAVRAALRTAERCATCPPPFDGFPLRAAAMLHTDRDEVERPASVGVEQWHPCPGPHARLAGLYAGLLALRTESRDFARRFFLAVARRCQWNGCLEEAERWGLDGLERFPRDAELLLGVGGVHEEAAALSWRTSTTGATAAPERNRRLKEARRFFSAALEADPGLVLARVRLGRVLWRLGESEAAQATLEQAVEGAPDPEVLYLGRLFLGQVYEDTDRVQEALREYRIALNAYPRAQSAAVALSHALRLAGDAQASREVLSRVLAEAGRRGGHDAYWNYLTMPAVHVEDLFTELRGETVR